MTTPLEADRLHLGPSATVSLYETLEGGPDRSSRPCSLRKVAGAVVAAVTPGRTVWCSLRSVEPVALRASFDGLDVLTGVAFEPGWPPESTPPHMYLPEQRFLDRAARADGTATTISGPDDPDHRRVLLLVAHRLRGRAFAAWWCSSGAEERWNRWGEPPTVLGGQSREQSDPAELAPDPFGPDDWDPDPVAVATLVLVHSAAGAST